MREQILALIENEQYQRLTVGEIAEKLGVVDAEAFKTLVKTLVSLEDEHILQRDKADRYDLIRRFGFKKGRIQVHKKGFGFVRLLDEEGDDVFIAKENLHGALNRDLVLIQVKRTKNGHHYEGEVVKVLERGTTSIIGVYTEEKNVGYVKSDDERFNQTIIINKNNSLGAVPDHKVKVEIIRYIDDNRVEGKVTEILGHKNDPGIDILSIVYKQGIPTVFPEPVLKQAESIPDSISPSDLIGRRDLRDRVIVTIDGEDAKDLDDAVDVLLLENGNYRLGVHIADVSYYVREGDYIDQEAFRRGTSVYLVDRVIPMIPHRLSNGICSLNPKVDRLVISLDMEINPRGEVVNYDLFPAVICTTERMTYTNVNKILVDQDPDVIKQYEALYPMFLEMAALFEILNQRRKARGSINFETSEAKIIVDEMGKPLDVQLRTRDIGEKIIEEFMLIANETIAEHFHWLNLPFLYRVHEDPDEGKIKRFFQLLNTLGYRIKGKENGVHPKAFQEVLERVEGEKEEAVINTMLLRSMAKARYSDQSLGHYGLATDYYTHFTSPIRRYPDTIVHRLIRTYHFEKQTDEATLNQIAEQLKEIAEQTSMAERRAVECEREVENMKKAEYMEEHIGEEFEGIISSVTNWGMYVELPNTIEGLVHVLDLTDDYYEFDEKTLSLIGERTKKIYRIGDVVNVRVIAASKQEGTIDFEIVGIKPRKREKVVEINNKAGQKPWKKKEVQTRNRRAKKLNQKGRST